ncbi:ankyrin repeat domain-containing protein [Erythrobacter arachoides]|uniref:Ankyrin repeat domain-containing protein n=1 Tax=Aurantiacibacter arachoides TaxID=1850444 RepID=A0A845A0T3_9SPHN|nr:ankyrin repeat domain-containing protein [Aurantiacibacter arachoides]
MITILAAIAGLAVAVPAAAQFYSDSVLFLKAVKDRNGTDATDLLNKPGSTVVNSRDITSGETGLHVVVDRRDLTWTRWLIQEGGNPNIADNRGRTPLIAAAEIGFLEGVEALIAGGARVDVANQTGETPLIAAVHSRNTQLMEILLRAGADPDWADNTGRSARDYAALRGVPPRILSIIDSTQTTDGAAASRVYGPVF